MVSVVGYDRPADEILEVFWFCNGISECLIPQYPRTDIDQNTWLAIDQVDRCHVAFKHFEVAILYYCFLGHVVEFRAFVHFL